VQRYIKNPYTHYYIGIFFVFLTVAAFFNLQSSCAPVCAQASRTWNNFQFSIFNLLALQYVLRRAELGTIFNIQYSIFLRSSMCSGEQNLEQFSIFNLQYSCAPVCAQASRTWNNFQFSIFLRSSMCSGKQNLEQFSIFNLLALQYVLRRAELGTIFNFQSSIFNFQTFLPATNRILGPLPQNSSPLCPLGL